AICLDQADGIISQCQRVGKQAECGKALDKRQLEAGVEHSVTHRIELLETASQVLDPGSRIAAIDCQRATVAPCNSAIWPQVMQFGMGEQPVRMLLGAFEIANPKQQSGCPGQSEAKRCRMALAFSILDGLPQAFSGLNGMPLQPAISCETDADKDVV